MIKGQKENVFQVNNEDFMITLFVEGVPIADARTILIAIIFQIVFKEAFQYYRKPLD